jgi:hypothetical protein
MFLRAPCCSWITETEVEKAIRNIVPSEINNEIEKANA